MKIIALILFLLLSAASLHAADKPVKVYSAHELQKIADGIYREMNNQGQEEQVEVNLLKNPSEAVTLKANPLKQIEKALEADNQDALRQIYHSAVSASSGETENKVSQPVAVTAPVRPAAPEVPAVVSRPAVRLPTVVWMPGSGASPEKKRFPKRNGRQLCRAPGRNLCRKPGRHSPLEMPGLRLRLRHSRKMPLLRRIS